MFADELVKNGVTPRSDFVPLAGLG
jgi:hypothetical protein